MRSVCTGLLIGSLLGCGSGPLGVEGTCIAVVNVHGVLFADSHGLARDSVAVSPDVYLEITRRTGCLDQGEPADPLSSGESNFLPVGTTLHRIEGIAPAERLAYRSSVWPGEWFSIAALPDSPGR